MMRRNICQNRNKCIKIVFFLLCLACSVCLNGCSGSKKDTEASPKDSDKIEAKAEPKSPADEEYDDEDVEIKDPAEAPVIEEITGISDTGGIQVLEALSEYGFSAVQVSTEPPKAFAQFFKKSA